MKKLHTLVIKAFIGPFIATFFITLFVLLMQFVWKYIDDLVGKGLDFLTIGELMLYASASLVPLALPLAVLLSSIMTYGSLGEHYELVALKSSGNSLLRIMFPLIVVVSMISVGAFYFANNIIPVANLKRSTLLFTIRQAKPSLNIRAGEFYQGIEGFSIKVGAKTEDGNILEDIIIYDHTKSSGSKKVIKAKKGSMKTSDDENFLIFRLFDGHSYETPLNQGGKNKHPFLRTEFSEEEIRFDLSSFQIERAKEELFKDHYRMLNISQLNHSMDSLEKRFDKRKKEFVQKSGMRLKLALDSTLGSKLSQVEVPADTIKAAYPILSNFKPRKHAEIASAASNLVRNNASYLRTIDKEFENRAERLAEHEIEWHRKFSLSAACLLLFFVGAPLGAIIRKGGLGLPFIFSTVIFIIYHVISITTEKMAKSLVIDPILGMWMASLIVLPIGFFLTYQTNRDAKFMSMDSYSNFFKKLFKKS